jgi:hypothetical protein
VLLVDGSHLKRFVHLVAAFSELVPTKEPGGCVCVRAQAGARVSVWGLGFGVLGLEPRLQCVGIQESVVGVRASQQLWVRGWGEGCRQRVGNMLRALREAFSVSQLSLSLSAYVFLRACVYVCA